MNIDNVLYFKKIVDDYYPDEDRAPIDIQSVVSKVSRDIQSLSDDDFCEVMISCFIPDLYSGMGKCEKLFTKLTELMVGEWWRRLGGKYKLPTKKSGTEDVELIYEDISIVCDAKVFRLGRSQKAPNVKDFLKLASVKLWIDNLNNSYRRNRVDRNVIGGLVTYSSLHEWESDSEVYEECTNHDTPVLMLPYEVLALLLKNKAKINIKDFSKIWDYSNNNVITCRQKSNYWDYVTGFICDLVSITRANYDEEMKEYHHRILIAAAEYKSIVQQAVDISSAEIQNELLKIQTLEELRSYTIQELEKRDNAAALDYLRHIDDFRYYRDQN